MITDDLKQKANWQIEQRGASVTITIACIDAYAAMLLHDKLVHAIEHGGVVLTYGDPPQDAA